MDWTTVSSPVIFFSLVDFVALLIIITVVNVRYWFVLWYFRQFVVCLFLILHRKYHFWHWQISNGSPDAFSLTTIYCRKTYFDSFLYTFTYNIHVAYTLLFIFLFLAIICFVIFNRGSPINHFFFSWYISYYSSLSLLSLAANRACLYFFTRAQHLVISFCLIFLFTLIPPHLYPYWNDLPLSP